MNFLSPARGERASALNREPATRSNIAFRNQTEGEHGTAQYSIVPNGDHWGVLHDGTIEGDFATKEAAFEAASMAASLSIIAGHEIHIMRAGRQSRREHARSGTPGQIRTGASCEQDIMSKTL